MNNGGGTLAEALARREDVTRHLNGAALGGLTDPANYLGLAPQMVDRVLKGSAAPTADSASGNT